MNVGDRIKQLRTEKNLTQPQLAELIGIEQSYLSKLENDKSVPSADIFQAILKGLAIDVGSFLQGIDEAITRGQLKQIPEVALHLNAQAVLRAHSIKKWLLGSALACTLGLTLVVAGYRALIFPALIYEYISGGVLKPADPDDMFLNLDTYSVAIGCGWGFAGAKTECGPAGVDYRQRQKAKTLLLDDYQGPSISLEDANGRRSYFFKGERQIGVSANRWLMLIGSFLAFGGLFGFIVEYRLRKI